MSSRSCPQRTLGGHNKFVDVIFLAKIKKNGASLAVGKIRFFNANIQIIHNNNSKLITCLFLDMSSPFLA